MLVSFPIHKFVFIMLLKTEKSKTTIQWPAVPTLMKNGQLVQYLEVEDTDSMISSAYFYFFPLENESSSVYSFEGTSYHNNTNHFIFESCCWWEIQTYWVNTSEISEKKYIREISKMKM